MRIEQMSMLEVAEMLMSKKKKEQKFYDLAKEVAEVKGFDYTQESDRIAQFYTDLVMSSKFVYCGDETFDLKSRRSTEYLDKEFFEEGQSEIDELQKQLDAMPRKVVEFKPEVRDLRRFENFIPNFDEEEEEEKEYLVDDYSDDAEETFEEEVYEEEDFEDEYEDMYEE